MQAFMVNLRSQLVAEGVLVEHRSGLRFVRDYVFNSPSTAAAVLLGRNANGRLEWKDDQGRTLRQISEASVEGKPAIGHSEVDVVEDDR